MTDQGQNNGGSVDTNALLQQLLLMMGQQQQAQTELLHVVANNQNAGTAGVEQAPPRTAAAKIPEPNRPPLLESNIPLEAFDSWRAAWEDYAACYQFETMSAHQQLARFRTFLSTDMRSELMHGIGISSTDDIKPDEALDRIRSYIRSRRNVAIDRVGFEERRQLDGEAFDEYYVSLQKIAKNADLCVGCFDERLTTRIMVGISNQETRKKLLALKPFPKLAEVVSICRSEESARNNEALLASSSSKPEFGVSGIGQSGATQPQPQNDHPQVAADRCPGFPNTGSQKPYQGQNPGTSKGVGSGPPPIQNNTCDFCGYGVHPRLNCPASQQTCNKCGKTGHFARVCRSRGPAFPQLGQPPKTKITAVRIQATSSDHGRNAPTVSTSVYGRSNKLLGFCNATPYTAAEATVANADVMRRLVLNVNNLLPALEGLLVAANGEALKCIGFAELEFKLGERLAKDRVYFCTESPGLLLSWYTCKNLAILPQEYPKPCYGMSHGADSYHDNGAHGDTRQTNVYDCIPQARDLSKNPTEGQIKMVREKLVEHFSDVFDDSETLKPMDCPPMKIHVKPGATPFALHTPQVVPLSWRDPVRNELEKLQAQGVIEPVPDDDTTEWCHPLVCVQKPKSPGEPRVCVDLTRLNTHVVRPLHPFPPPKDAVSQIPNGCQYFSLLDARKGYFQLQLHPESRHLTTFITPWGRYRFLRGPMGLCSTGDEFCKQGDKALHGIGNVQKVVDDLIAYDVDFHQHLSRLWSILCRCREKSIILSAAKLQFAASQVTYCGYQICKDGISADPEKLKAISAFPQPKNITELRSFFGLVNQLGQFSHFISAKAEPLRPLLSVRNEFFWTAVHTEAFRNVKEAICKPPILATFQIGLKTRLYTDASRINGLGFLLVQQHGDQWKLVECGSRFLTDTESRYSTIELELLAALWATDKCRIYLIGNPHYDLKIDNKPLVSILNGKGLEDITNPRIQHLKEKLAPYTFTANWIKGKDNLLAGILSRAPVSQPSEADKAQAKMISAVTTRAMKDAEQQLQDNLFWRDPVLENMVKQASADSDYQLLIDALRNDFRVFHNKNAYLLSFSKLKDQLTLGDGLILLGPRIVVPNSMKRQITEWLHTAHVGLAKNKARARQCVFWPGMNSDMEDQILGCEKCQQRLPSLPKEPMVSDPEPEWVFQEAATDLFQHAGRHYLVYVDRLSGWPAVCDYGKNAPSTRQVLRTLRIVWGSRCPSKVAIR